MIRPIRLIRPIRPIFFLFSAFLVALAGILIYSFFFSKEAAAWFNESWLYRTHLTITHNAAVSNNKVKFDIDTATLISIGKMQSDCGDSRFTDINGKLLKYYLDSSGGACNTNSTDYYILIPTINNGTTVIYHYYGNPSAPNGTEASQFSEPTLTPSGSYAAGSEAQGPGPVGYWSFNDGQGTTAQDSSSTNNDGTISGATWQTEDRCVAGKCLHFDGSDDNVSLADNTSLSITESLTVGGWVRRNRTGQAEVIISKWDGGAQTQKSYELQFNGNDRLQLFVTSDGSANSSTVDAGTQITDQNWHYVAGVYDGVNLKVYLDGILQSAATASYSSGIYNSTANFKVGADDDGSNLKGFIDDVKIYPYARTAAQVKTDYLAGKANASARSGTSAVLGANSEAWLSDGLVGYWKMDETSGTRADSSGNGNTLTDNNTVTSNPGKFGNAGQFTNANSESLSLADNTTLSTGDIDFTVSAWVYADSLDSRVIVAKQSADAAGEYQLAYVTAGGLNKFRFLLPATSESVAATVPSPANTGTWYFVVAWHDSTANTINIQVDNGTIYTTSSVTAPSDTNATFRIGAGASSGDAAAYFWDGRIDEVRVYKRLLSSKERTDLYNWAPGPVGYWDFEEGGNVGVGSTAFDRSGNSNPGIWSGTGAKHTDTGKFGKAGKFNGSDDYVDLTNNSPFDFTSTNSWTLSAWIKTSTTSDNAVISRMDANQDYKGYEIMVVGSNGHIAAGIVSAWSTNNTHWIESTNTVNDGKWHYVVVTYDGSETVGGLKIYRDGQLETPIIIKSSFVASSSIDPDKSVKAGARTNNTGIANLFNGTIDDVKVYNYARTQKQIVQDMNAGHPNVGSPVGSAVGHWKFDEGQGIVANNSGSAGSALNGTLTSMASPATATSGWTQSGKFGKALIFDGTNDYVNTVNTTSLQITDRITISAWAYIDPAGTMDGSLGYIVAKTIGDTSTGGYSLWFDDRAGQGTNAIKAYGINSDQSYYDLVANNAIPAAGWYHLVVTYDKDAGGTNEAKLYVNGILATTYDYSKTIKSDTYNLTIGSDSNGAQRFTGTIDEVKIYNYALTADEVKLDYNKGSSLQLGAAGNNSSYAQGAANQEYCIPGDTSTCSAPVGRWDFEEGSGTAVNDTSGNANTGTWNGTGSRWTSGKVGKGGKFNGSSDYVSTQSKTYGPALTIEAWIKPNAIGAYQSIFNVCDDPDSNCNGGNYKLIELRIDNNEAVTAMFAHDSQLVRRVSATTSSSGLFKAGTWYHIAATFDTSTNAEKIYINGVSQTLTTDNVGSGAGSFSAAPFIGTLNNVYGGAAGAQYFNGLIDQLRVFDYVRTPAQIAYDYNRGGPVGWWKFDECQGATAYDSSPSTGSGQAGNNGTITIGASGEDTLGTCTTSSTAWGSGIAGKRNASLSLDGTDDKVTIGGAIAGIQSVAFWVKPATNTDSYVDLDGGTHYITSSSGTVSATGFSSPTIYVNGVSNGTITGNAWNHVLVTPGTGFNTTSSFTLGYKSAVTADYLNGQIDDVRVYNYALTATQVKDVYNNGALSGARRAGEIPSFLPTDVAGLKLWVKADSLALNDGDPVGTWADQSGNGNDLVQATAAKKPTYKANILNGLPVV